MNTKLNTFLCIKHDHTVVVCKTQNTVKFVKECRLVFKIEKHWNPQLKNVQRNEIPEKLGPLVFMSTLEKTASREIQLHRTDGDNATVDTIHTGAKFDVLDLIVSSGLDVIVMGSNRLKGLLV